MGTFTCACRPTSRGLRWAMFRHAPTPARCCEAHGLESFLLGQIGKRHRDPLLHGKAEGEERTPGDVYNHSFKDCYAGVGTSAPQAPVSRTRTHGGNLQRGLRSRKEGTKKNPQPYIA